MRFSLSSIELASLNAIAIAEPLTYRVIFSGKAQIAIASVRMNETGLMTLATRCR